MSLPSVEEFEQLKLQVATLLSATSSSSEPSPAERQQAAQEQVLALLTDLKHLRSEVYHLPEGPSSLFTPLVGAAPSNGANPYPRPPGVCVLSPQFSLQDTPAGQELARGLGVQTGYWKEAQAWIPVASTLWDITATFAGLLCASDTPPAVILTTGPRVLELHQLIDACLRKIRPHELRATSNTSLADAYATHLALSSRAARYLPADIVAFDESASRELQKRALKNSTSSSGSSGKKKTWRRPKATTPPHAADK